MFKACKNASKILMESFEETALISGISDIIVVEWGVNDFKTSPFLVCLGSMTYRAKNEEIKVFVNDVLIDDVKFTINRYGYLEPFHPPSSTIAKLKLVNGKNSISFKVSTVSLGADIFLYERDDRIIISDLDGTMTKTDITGLLSNYRQVRYIHDGYDLFIKELFDKGYKIVWITMRSIALYNFSKNYIEKEVGCFGALLPEPEEFFPAVKKEVMKNTGNVKTNMIKMIKDLFPPNINPFSGGLGNRENDAIAYMAVGIPPDRIYLVSEESEIMTMNKVILKSYVELHQEIETHFPTLDCKGQKRQEVRRNSVSIFPEMDHKSIKEREKEIKKYFNVIAENSKK